MKLFLSSIINLFLILIIVSLTLFLIFHWPREIDSNSISYKNHKLVQLTPQNDEDIKKIIFVQKIIPVIPWSNVLRSGWPIIFQVSPNLSKSFVNTVDAFHLPFTVITSNLQEFIDGSQKSKKIVKDFVLNNSSDFNLNRYHYLAEIEAYLNKLSEEKTTRLILNSYGTSMENRQLNYVHIFKSMKKVDENSTLNEIKDKKLVIFECGTHAREWLSPAVCLHIINNLVNDEDSQSLLEDYEFYVLPVVNPDGYVYTWTRDRLWRKNRRRFANNCYGVDLNRNFNIGFNASEVSERVDFLQSLINGTNEDSSFESIYSFLESELKLLEEKRDNKTFSTRLKRNKSFIESAQCSSLYPGERPFSESETFFLKRFVDRLIIKPSVYFSLHSYSQMWLYPFGTNLKSNSTKKLQQFAKIGVESIKKENNLNETWVYGRAIDVMYNAGGISVDWAHQDVGIDLVYSLEMRDSGYYGFLLPDDQIEAAAKETWAGINSVLRAYLENSKNSTANETNEE